MKKAFTLIELLVVIAIIAILAAILFPVFAQAKVAAKKATAISDAKQWCLCDHIYQTDYDDNFPVWIYNGTFDVDQGDRDFLNVEYAYTKNSDITKTAQSPFTISNREHDVNFPNPDTKVGDSIINQDEYNLGWLTDYGINYQDMDGFTVNGSGQWACNPQPASAITRPGTTFEFMTGDFNRTASGSLEDGGQLPIDPPAYHYQDGTLSIVTVPGGGIYFFGGWNPDQPLAWNVFGGAWPYYANEVICGFMDGHVKPEQPSQMATGCYVLDFWGGYVTDPSSYQWGGPR